MNRHPVVRWWQRLAVLVAFFLGVYLVSGAVALVRGDHTAPEAPERTPAAMAADTASLQREVLPILRELRVTWFEQGPCAILDYRRGMFTADGACAGHREGERTFDATARADLNRILTALAHTGVPTKNRATATYLPTGDLEFAGFSVTDTRSYMYSPQHPPSSWEGPLGTVTQSPLETPGWYLQNAAPA